MNRVPVLIAARNEANTVGRALESLCSQAEPIVIPNGCTDQTAEIAERLGARVLRTELEGKMTALQEGIRYLGKRALEPFVTLDADSRPIFPKYWLNSLLRARSDLPEDNPAVTTGPIIYRGGASIFSDAYLTVNNIRRYVLTRNDCENGPTCGGNMLLHTRRAEVVDEILDLPQVWPGTDECIKDVIIANGGAVLRSVNPGAAILTDSSRYFGLWRRYVDGLENTRCRYFQTYSDEAPPNATSVTDYRLLS